MSDGSLADAGSVPGLQIWDGVVARAVHGERVTIGLIELDPGAVVPEHSHDNEQLGFLVQGSLTFTIGGETGEVAPGGSWRILSHVPHSVVAGPEGAVAVEVFAPPRHDWGSRPEAPRPARWP
jgi:quercetin dioxygenase-like cupin family protein